VGGSFHVGLRWREEERWGEWLRKLFDQPTFEAQMKIRGLALLPFYPQVIEHIYSCERLVL